MRLQILVQIFSADGGISPLLHNVPPGDPHPLVPGVTLLRVTSSQSSLPPQRAALMRALADGMRSEGQPCPALNPTSMAMLINPQSSWQNTARTTVHTFCKIRGRRKKKQQQKNPQQQQHIRVLDSNCDCLRRGCSSSWIARVLQDYCKCTDFLAIKNKNM